MAKVFFAAILALVLLIIPASSQAPASTGGETETLGAGGIPQESRGGLELSLAMPLAGPSIHTNYIGSAQTFVWGDINSGTLQTYGVIGGRFIYQPGDTWFVYGIFGPIEAVKYDWNVKYSTWGGWHNGIDFAVDVGTPVLAASGGEVTFVGVRTGNTIVVRTDNFYTTYSHLDSFNVEVGERVAQGQVIGNTGSSGTINPHLHFQIDEHRGGVRWGINPAKYLFAELQEAIIPDVPTNRYDSSVSWDQRLTDELHKWSGGNQLDSS